MKKGDRVKLSDEYLENFHSKPALLSAVAARAKRGRVIGGKPPLVRVLWDGCSVKSPFTCHFNFLELVDEG